ncbi:hypothetical protein BDV95DRAFT_497277, partial [Massariosphaeria phaeospora]
HEAPSFTVNIPPGRICNPAVHISSIPPTNLCATFNNFPSRLNAMHAAGIAMQVIGPLPTMGPLMACTRVNNYLYMETRPYLDKFACLALLPATDPENAAHELERCVAKYGFVGGVLPVGRFTPRLNDPRWERLWQVAQKWEAPIALRASWPTAAEMPEIMGDFPPRVGLPLLENFCREHLSSPIPLLHLYLSRVFDRQPSLKIIVSQSGLGLPSSIPRIRSVLESLPQNTQPVCNFEVVFRRNIWVTTTGLFDRTSLMALMEYVSPDRLLYGENYPWKDSRWNLKESLEGTTFVTEEDKEKIGSKNAKLLFRLWRQGQ